MDIFEKCYQRYIQDEVREQGVYPYFHALESRQDTEVIMESKRRIMLGSNNYLGLTTNSSVIEAGVQAYRTLGSGCSGSRFLNGTLKLHLELEDELAKFLRKDAVVTFSTGFQSNLGIISSIVGLHDYVIMDRENHASLYDGCKLSYGKMLRYQHNDMADLEKKLQKVPDTAGCLIVTDGVFSMGGDIANLPEICALAQKYGARVMVDDAHGSALSARAPRHGKLLRPGGSGRYLHGHVLQVSCLARRLYGGQQPRGRLRASQLASVHLLRLHSARKHGGGPCGPARARGASRARHDAAGERKVHARPSERAEHQDAPVQRRLHPHHSHLHL